MLITTLGSNASFYETPGGLPLLPTIANAVDLFNVITYDSRNDNPTSNNVASSLNSTEGVTEGPMMWSKANATLDDYVVRGVPAEKLLLGLVTYGVTYGGVMQNAAGQPATGE